MVIADLAAGDDGVAENLPSGSIEVDKYGPLNISIGFELAPAYDNAKLQFVHTGIDSQGHEGKYFIRLGGMTHGHWCPTYYLLARYLK